MHALSDWKPGVGLNDMRTLMKAAAISSDESKEIFESLLHPYSFLKHGSSNFSVENDVSLDYIVATIYTAIHSYRLLFGNLTSEMKVFYCVVQSWRIHWWQGTEGFEEKLKIARKLPFIGASREKCASLAGTSSEKHGNKCRSTHDRAAKSALSLST